MLVIMLVFYILCCLNYLVVCVQVSFIVDLMSVCFYTCVYMHRARNEKHFHVTIIAFFVEVNIIFWGLCVLCLSPLSYCSCVCVLWSLYLVVCVKVNYVCLCVCRYGATRNENCFCVTIVVYY